jgi:hypothetical protein
MDKANAFSAKQVSRYSNMCHPTSTIHEFTFRVEGRACLMSTDDLRHDALPAAMSRAAQTHHIVTY